MTGNVQTRVQYNNQLLLAYEHCATGGGGGGGGGAVAGTEDFTIGRPSAVAIRLFSSMFAFRFVKSGFMFNFSSESDNFKSRKERLVVSICRTDPSIV